MIKYTKQHQGTKKGSIIKINSNCPDRYFIRSKNYEVIRVKQKKIRNNAGCPPIIVIRDINGKERMLSHRLYDLVEL